MGKQMPMFTVRPDIFSHADVIDYDCVVLDANGKEIEDCVYADTDTGTVVILLKDRNGKYKRNPNFKEIWFKSFELMRRMSRREPPLTVMPVEDYERLKAVSIRNGDV
jgi:MoaA/NifB/PqqE/SkfB family radical SAM enzyme